MNIPDIESVIQAAKFARAALTPEELQVTCAACYEDLGTVRAEEGYTARWWADKTLLEHVLEYHS